MTTGCTSNNLFTIDADVIVKADSVPMQNIFREICAQQEFEEHLEKMVSRISAIESLGRTREITIKDLRGGGKYEVLAKSAKCIVENEVSFSGRKGQ